MKQKINLVINQGATYSKSLPIRDTNDNERDLTGFTGQCMLRKHHTSANSYSFAVEVANTSTITISMNAEDTGSVPPGRYMYDLIIRSDDNITERVYEGLVTVVPAITK